MPRTILELIECVPESTVERTRPLGSDNLNRSGEYILYWMRTAVRVDENPALDFAIHAGNQLRLPIFVFHGLSEEYTYASDRHHTFILQGARDVQAALLDRGLAFACHVERPGHRGPHLLALANRAALVVTEDMPVEPLRSWTRALGRRTETPIIAVDTSCVVPMRLVGQAYDRAFAFRQATKERYEERLTRLPVTVEAERPASLPARLPFEPLELQSADLPKLVAACDIDHTIGPVPHTIGGTIAGYQRWGAFKDNKIQNYARFRNNPLADAVSRISAYLHYGMVSPQRIAREAAEIDGDGAEKFLDEMLIWREMAYAFCFYRQDHHAISALPDWAIATLASHESDRRPALMSWERLARGQTNDLLWDAAQKSLLIHGELHNNVRMTWGKAVLNWTNDARQAFATMTDLNHRYALDGRDPASYGGILWCLGQFDRPFPPPRPIFGTVRDRSTQQHAERLDPQAYLQQTTRPLDATMPIVAVIGAGISGLHCARTLQDHGLSVNVFEKSRGAGGRMSTRRTDDALQFDHGAQYFTARDAFFRRYVDSWRHDGIVAPWQGRIVALKDGTLMEEKQGTDRFVAIPGMNAVCQHLANDLTVQYQTKVAPPRRHQGRWLLTSEAATDLGTYDAVIISAPAAQTAELLSEVPKLAEQAYRVDMSGCWAVMLAVEKPLELPFDAAFVHQSPLSWIARNSGKPHRLATPETWVLHASAEWSEANLEQSPERVEAHLLTEFWRAVGAKPKAIRHSTAHRWRFAIPTLPLEPRCLFDTDLQIGACGDWCGGPRVEGAFLSGAAAAGRVLGLLSQTTAVARTDSLHQRQLF